jgi:hypothetical protein
MGGKSRTAPTPVARIAARQHGNITRRQLLHRGLSARVIERRVEGGTLIGVHRGVYRVGHAAPSVEADYMAAVLACGDDAALRGRAAAHLLGIVKGKAPAAEVVTSRERRVRGVYTLRCRSLHRSELTRWRGIPVTTPARTLVDLAAFLSPEDLARACHEAGVRHHTSPRQVRSVLARRSNARGAAKFGPILVGDAPVILSWMERRALEILERERLPRPQVNRKRGAHYVDLRWPDYRLTVELNSYRYHHSRHAWEEDQRRRRAARGRRDTFLSYTYEDVVEEREMVDELRGVLGPT